MTCVLIALILVQGLVQHDPVHGPPDVAQPAPKVVRVRPAAPATRSVTGTASWYCGHGSPCAKGHAGGLYAAAGPALRTGRWRGRLVTVRSLGRVVRVRLIDWCACPRRALDLYSDAFEALAHYRDKYGYHTGLHRGVLKVTVSW